ncbi:MAG TPA: DeoR/GlpR family DNA-binding transcription regulator [Gemmataceae bacterium]|jgi:DeoR/GlpR family transcriptional regulator of sugar metabolism|nr:DeoR/GlpR family DNA-binding transcription regulator [Gemmataceae bacterium]
MSGSSVLLQERRKRVLDLVSRKGFVGLAELAKAVKVSESTLRRDLDHWDEQGLLKRIHGGAMFVGDDSLPALEERSSSQIAEKRLVAREAAERIRDGDAVLLDGGTTTLEVARLLVGRSVQIVTNSLPIANLFASSRETDLVMLGGYVYPRTGVALGPLTVRMMQDIHVHQTILSIGGLTERGLFNSNLLLVEAERQMMQCADEVMVVADHTKIGRSNLAFLCDLSTVDLLIVDAGLSPEQRRLLEQAEVKMVVANGGKRAEERAP